MGEIPDDGSIAWPVHSEFKLGNPRAENTDLGHGESRSAPLQNSNSQIRRHPARSP